MMKTTRLSIGLIFIFAAIVFNNCAKEEMSLVPGPEEEISSLKKAMTSGYVPGTDITVQLRSDLENGLSVTLPAGHFYLSESIWVFSYPGGTVKGAGKHLTVIEAAEEFGAPQRPDFPDNSTQTSMLDFPNAAGDITIKSMSFVVKGADPAEVHHNPFYGGYNSTNIDNVIAATGDGISLECIDLLIKGEYVGGDVAGAFNGYNITWPIVGTGWGGGEFNKLIVKDCEIEGAGGAGIDVWMGRSCECKDNKVSNSATGIMLLLVTEAITIKDCHFDNISSSVIYEDGIGEDCLYCIKDNTLDGEPMEDDSH